MGETKKKAVKSFWKPACLVILTSLFLLGGFSPSHAAQVTLAWDASTDPAVTGYKLYSGYTSRSYGTPVNVGKVTQFTLTNIQEGKNCYFAVKAYDTKGNESTFSSELECFTIVPAPSGNCAINPSSAVVVSRGMNQTFTVQTSSFSLKWEPIDARILTVRAQIAHQVDVSLFYHARLKEYV